MIAQLADLLLLSAVEHTGLPSRNSAALAGLLACQACPCGYYSMHKAGPHTASSELASSCQTSDTSLPNRAYKPLLRPVY